CAGLFVLIATNAYLTKKLAENSAGMVTAAELLKSIEEANSAQIAFGELRYWMTDLAVSQLTMAERNAAAARARVEQHLDQLQPWNPQRIETVRSEIAQYEDLAGKAVEEYTDDRRVIGNSLLAQARQHSLVADQLIASIVQELTGAAIAARQRVVAEAETATRLSQIVAARAVEFSHAQAGMIYEVDEAAREFRFRTSHGAEPALTEELRAAPIRFGEGAISAAAVAGSPAQIRDLLGERQLGLPNLSDALARLGYRSLIAAPLLHEQDILGGLVVARREAGEFSKEVV